MGIPHAFYNQDDDDFDCIRFKEGEIYLLLDNSIEESDQSQKIRRREAVSGGKTPRPLKDNDDDE